MTQTWNRACAERRWHGLLIATLAAILASIMLTGPSGAQTTCGSIQARVNNAAAGTTVNLPDGCIYREMVTINKPVTLIGGPGVGIRGSEVWTGWTKKSDTRWVRGKVPSFSSRGYCEEGTSRCRWPEQVFFDDKPLAQVASSPKSGQFAVNDQRQVILADNPSRHRVEVTVRRQWVVGRSGGVTVEGFNMRHAANEPQGKAGITNGGHSNWTIRNNTLSDVHGAVVSLTGGTGLRLVGNDISRGGQLGVHGGGGAALVMQNNKIHHNNTENFRTGWEAGGVKAVVRSLMAEGNEVYDNNGLGMWTDVGSTNITYANNRIHHNKKMGINIERSSNVKAYGNELWENGWGRSNWGWGAGIVSSSSKDVEIHHNTLAWNADGISVISQNRGGTFYDLIKNVKVHNNTILAKDYPSTKDNYALAWLQDWDGGVLFKTLSGNRGYDNRYWYPSKEGTCARFKWDRAAERMLAHFNATLGEEDGRYLSDTQKSNVIGASGVPASPSSR